MAIRVTRTPARLAWTHFREVPTLVDPADGEAIDAYTAFNYALSNEPPDNVNGQLVPSSSMTITITPNCRVRRGARKTADLLAHEQFHYDVGLVTGRALARHLSHLSAPTLPALRAQVRQAIQLHFVKRTGLLQRRYDKDTRHGTNGHYQRIWTTRMRSCVGNANSRMLGGFWL